MTKDPVIGKYRSASQRLNMQFAIAIPQQFADRAFDPDHLQQYLARAEQLGFGSAWTAEAVLGTASLLAPLETLTYAAACNSNLRLGCAVLISPLYGPVHLAKSLSTLDQLSRGRLEVGIASGGRFRMFSAFAVEPDTYLARFSEGLRLMKALWTQDRVTFAGRFWQLDNAAMEPKPFQKPYPRIWIGGSHPDALRRVARLGDGFMGAGASTTAEFARQVHVLREALKASGRDSSEFSIAKRVYMSVDSDSQRARSYISKALDRFYGNSGKANLLRAAVAGTPNDCVNGLREIIRAGAELILVDPISQDIEQMELLASDVLVHIT